MYPSRTFDPTLHEAGSIAARGKCSYHGDDAPEGCAGEAVVSFQDDRGQWVSGCSVALEHLVEKGEIEPLGQGS